MKGIRSFLAAARETLNDNLSLVTQQSARLTVEVLPPLALAGPSYAFGLIDVAADLANLFIGGFCINAEVDAIDSF